MRKKIVAISVIVVLFLSAAPAFAAGSSVAILRQGLLGAGTGAVATAVGGAKGDDVWKGALVGMGVNVVGGALLDVITSPNGTRTVVYAPQQQIPVRQVAVTAPRYRKEARKKARRRVFEAGYANGYRQGYSEGYEDALEDIRFYY